MFFNRLCFCCFFLSFLSPNTKQPQNDGTARLLSGDCSGAIYLWHGCERAAGRGQSAVTPQGPFVGHRASVEDLQWSPSEATIFASCSSDCSIRIWDARVPGTAGAAAVVSNVVCVCERAHAQDVNVISWNRLQNFLLASGSDDGSFRVWDLRAFKEFVFFSSCFMLCFCFFIVFVSLQHEQCNTCVRLPLPHQADHIYRVVAL